MYINKGNIFYCGSKSVIKSFTQLNPKIDKIRKDVTSVVKTTVIKDIWGNGVWETTQALWLGVGGGFVVNTVLSFITGGMGPLSGVAVASLLEPGFMAASY